MTSKIQMGELFAGIGGFYQGFKNAFGEDLEVVYANEWDKYANKNYLLLHGLKPTDSDIREVDEKDLPKLDILTLGTPCVSFSHAGCQLGFDDMRGTVFFDAMRIAKEKKPKVVIVENVKGLINNDNGNSVQRILETMNDIGYYVDIELLDSKYYQVAQQRERVYIVGIRKDLIKQGQWRESYTTPTLTKRKQLLSHIESFSFDWNYGSTPNIVFNDIMKDSIDSKYYYSPLQVSSFEGNETYEQQLLHRNINNVHELTMVGKLQALKGNDSIKRVYSHYSYLPTLTTMEGGHRQPKVAYFKEDELVIRKATPNECWLAQGFTDEQFNLVSESTSDAQLYKQSGNAVTVNVIESIANVIKSMNVLDKE